MFKLNPNHTDQRIASRDRIIGQTARQYQKEYNQATGQNVDPMEAFKESYIHLVSSYRTMGEKIQAMQAELKELKGEEPKKEEV